MAVDAGVKVLTVAVFRRKKHFAQVFVSDIYDLKLGPGFVRAAAQNFRLFLVAAKADVDVDRRNFDTLGCQ